MPSYLLNLSQRPSAELSQPDLPWIEHATIWLDQAITRRKRFHVLTDEDGEPIYAAGRLSEALAWCSDHGVHRITLVDERGRAYDLSPQAPQQQ